MQPDPQLLQAVRLVLHYGSVEAAARHGGMNRRIMETLVEKAVAMGYLSDASTKAPEQRTGRVLHISDVHAPYHHADALDFVLALREKYRCNLVVFAGDELDGHALSVHPVDPNGQSPGDELELGLAEMRRWYDAIPEAMLCVSNHGSRPYRKAFLAGLPSQYLRSYAEFMGSPEGWKWADEWEIDGVVYSHGEGATGANGALQLAIRQGKSQAVGHWHGVGGASHFSNGDRTLFGLYSGCLIDPASFAFRYGKHSKAKPVLGSSVVLEGLPLFVPMPLDRHGRWTGQL